jgi:hypothetical protein
MHKMLSCVVLVPPRLSTLGKEEHSLTQQEARTMLLAQIIKEIRYNAMSAMSFGLQFLF